MKSFVLTFVFMGALIGTPLQALAHSSPSLSYPVWGGGFSLEGGVSVVGASAFGFDVLPHAETVVGELRFLLTRHYALDVRGNLTTFPYWHFALSIEHSYHWKIPSGRLLLGLGTEVGFFSFLYLGLPLKIAYELLLRRDALEVGIQFSLRPFVYVLPASGNPFLFGGGATFAVTFYFYPLSQR